ncbi:TPA_asm: hypothetical protein ES702_05926 [Lokiarchaeia virus SkuldV3]|uniref:Uncharacterized protein n=1 Tax=Lokiarchaeia virus SkuldV3 TaxID=2983915 RepID=A0A9N7AB89_9VIRU|nr:hypothetical protein QKT74_gp23 [Lokiarchaeia virus SkuldV3]DAZ90963.1 TPA_asm: hypothetical protein ES702_05926 [Lokiarchaeia virus SkuldV3]
MSLFDKLIEDLGNLRTVHPISYCSLCKLLKERTIEISIQERPNFDFLLNVVLCENCFKEYLEVIFG